MVWYVQNSRPASLEMITWRIALVCSARVSSPTKLVRWKRCQTWQCHLWYRPVSFCHDGLTFPSFQDILTVSQWYYIISLLISTFAQRQLSSTGVTSKAQCQLLSTAESVRYLAAIRIRSWPSINSYLPRSIPKILPRSMYSLRTATDRKSCNKHRKTYLINKSGKFS